MENNHLEFLSFYTFNIVNFYIAGVLEIVPFRYTCLTKQELFLPCEYRHNTAFYSSGYLPLPLIPLEIYMIVPFRDSAAAPETTGDVYDCSV